MKAVHTSVAVLGGDERFCIIAELLKKRGYSVSRVFAGNSPADESDLFKALDASEAVLLPLPAMRDGSHINVSDAFLTLNNLDISQTPTVLELLMRLKSRRRILGGMLPSWLCRRCEEYGIVAQDYFLSKKLEIRNVIPTVEGCIGILISSLKTTVFSSEILITGYGKIGSVLADYLKMLGAKVTCAARKESDLTWMRLRGHEPITYSMLRDNIGRFDVVINTVPAPVITRESIEKSKPGCFFIDLASKPGGIDGQAAAEYSRGFIHALSLPGKTAPVSAAGYIFEAVCELLEAEENI